MFTFWLSDVIIIACKCTIHPLYACSHTHTHTHTYTHHTVPENNNKMRTPNVHVSTHEYVPPNPPLQTSSSYKEPAGTTLINSTPTVSPDHALFSESSSIPVFENPDPNTQVPFRGTPRTSQNGTPTSSATNSRKSSINGPTPSPRIKLSHLNTRRQSSSSNGTARKTSGTSSHSEFQLLVKQNDETDMTQSTYM